MKSILTALFAIITSVLMAQSMSGTYTIGGTSPDYSSISAAITAVTTNGVSGAVTFNIRNGVYNEQLSIGSISGVSSTNTITFQSQNLDSTLVTITYSPTSSANYSLRLNGCDYVIFRKLTLKSTGTTYSNVVRMESSSTYNRLENNIIEGPTANSSSSYLALIYCYASSVNDTRFQNNHFKNGSVGIYFSASVSNIQILQNTFTGQFYRALECYNLSGATISGNSIFSGNSYSSYEGIYLSYCGSNLILTKNKINLTYGFAAVNMSSCSASSSSRGLIANNFISITNGSGNGYGFYFYGTNYQNLYYNSVSVSQGSYSYASIYLGGSSASNFQLQNNILTNNGSGYVIFSDYSGTINVSDYNNLYSAGGYIAYWYNSSCYNLASWQSKTSLDAHSVSINPEFKSSTDLHVQAYQLDNLGYPVSGVSEDIDGQSRHYSTPDIGADEWTTPANDAGVTSIDQNLTYCITNDSVYVTIKNYGTANLTSVKINWSVNGTAQTQKSWTGNLTQGSSFGPFSIGYYNFNLGTAYSVYAWTSAPNNGTEGFTHNDSSNVLNKYKAMYGTYTIGGTSPDYSSFAAAISDLTNGGVCGPVVFNIRNGIYTEQLSIGSISGTSSTNTVTFQSQANDSSSVTITFAPISSANYTVRFNGCDYVIFRKMKVIATGTTYATVFRIEASSIFNKIENCQVIGSNTNTTNTNLANIYCYASSNNNLQINYNFISNGSIGIFLNTSSSSVQINGNIVSNQYYRAMDIYSISNLTITGNVVTSNTNYYSYESIYLYGCGNNLVFTKNRIILSYGQSAVNLNYCSASSSTRGLIANNFISITNTTGNGNGFYLYNTNYQNFYYNSLNVPVGSYSYASLYIGGGSSYYLQLQNNNLTNNSSGYIIYSDYSGTINVSDYNNLYSSGGYIAYWYNTTCSNLASWQNKTSLDAHSVSINPEFKSKSDLHVQAYLLDNLGYPVSGVSEDIDGQSRHYSTPDIGADEWTTPVNDAGVTSIDQNLTYCITNDSVYVTIKNFGTANLTSVRINWSVNGTTQTQKSWSGNLTQGSSIGPFSIGYYNFNLGTAYSVYAWTSAPNSGTEGFNHNDSSSVLNKYKAMYGTYTIGGTSPDYSTFAAAISDLTNGGVCGPVVFNIRNGIYTEQISIGQISGTSSANTVTFQSQSGDSTAVTITYAPISSANYTLRFNGCDFVKFKKMKLVATGTSYANVVRIESSSTDNSIENCLLIGSNTTSSSNNLSVIYVPSGNNSNTTIVNNKISDGSSGIYIYGTSSNIIIQSNNFTNQYYHAIDITYVSNLQIIKNLISSSTSYSSYEAVYLNNSGTNLLISKNRITLNYGYSAINMYACSASGSSRGTISNNFITVNTANSSSGYGIYLYNSNYQNFYYNSVNYLRNVSSNSVLYISGSSSHNIQLQNNNFYNKGGGYVLQSDYSGTINMSDYNNFITTGYYLAYIYNSSLTSLTSWKSSTNLDQHSVSITPDYFSTTDLHTQNYLLDNLGYPVSGINDDIDGQSRHYTNPDIGADEWTTPQNDAGVYSIDQALTYCITNDSVFVTIKNFGSDTLKSVKINWKVNGTSQTQKSWTGKLLQGSSIGPFSIGYYNFNLGTAYSINAWTSLPNNATDGLNYNDSASVSSRYKSISGTYTIGGTSPDYSTISAAVTDLVNGGVCGPVTFNIRNGVYNEQVSIGPINGTSSNNTVTFKSQTDDSSKVSITYTASSSSANYTIRFNGCSYVNFSKIKIIGSGTTYGNVVKLEYGSTNIKIERCILQGSSTTSTSNSMSVIFCNGGNNSNTSILQNKITDGSFGIYLSSSSTNITINLNNFTNQYYKALDIYSVSYLTFSKNTVTSNTNYTSYTGVSLYGCGSNLVFTQNKISLNNGLVGLDMQSCTASSTTRGLIANNFISVAGSSYSAYGINLGNNNYQNFYYNSINITRTSSNTYAFYNGGSSGYNLQLQNNIFSNSGGGYAIFSSYTGQFSLCDYNNLYTSGSYLAFWYSTTYSSLSAWKSATGLDQHSYSVNPGFSSAIDLHLCNSTLNGTADPISGISDDIDGQQRNSTTPDIGADEFTSNLTVNLGSDKMTCSSVQLDAGNSGSSYLWSTSETSQTITATSPGTYWVKVTNACGSAYDTIVLSNKPAVPGNISGSDSLCTSATGKTYSINSVSGATTYLWTIPTGWTITSGQGTNSISVSCSTNSGSICVSAGSGCAYSNTSCKTITITQNLAAPTSISGDTLVCAGDTNLIYSTPVISSATSYNWTVPSGWTIKSGQGTKQIKVASGNSGGNICVSATGNCNTTSSFCITVGLIGNVSTPGTISGLKSICPNQSGITYSISAVSGATSYTWTVPSGWNISTGQGTNSVIVNASSTTGDICVKANNKCMSSSASCLSINFLTTPNKPDTVFGLLSVCPSQTGLTYSVSSVSGASNYSWSVPSGWSILSGQGSNTISVNAGSSSGDICVSAANSCNSSSATCIAVKFMSQLSKPDTIIGSKTICQSQSGLTYTASSVSGATSYTWSVPSGWIITSGQGTSSITVNSGASAGNICVTANNSCSSSSPECIYINFIPIITKPDTIFGNVLVCPSQGALSYSISNVYGASSYTWTVPAGWNISSGQGTSQIVVDAGTLGGSICVKANNSCGSSSFKCLEVGLIQIPSKPSKITGPLSACQGQSGLIYSIPVVSGATTYNWTVPIGWSIISGQGTNFITVTTGNLTGDICVQALNKCAASAGECLTVTIISSPSKPASIIGNSTICAQSGDLKYNVTSVIGASSYIWTLPSGWSFVSGQGNDTIIVNAGTNTGNISVYAQNSCGVSGTKEQLILVYPLPSQPVITKLGKDLLSSETFGNQWYLDTNAIAGATSQTYTPNKTGWYKVIVTDANGCKSTSIPVYYIYTSGVNQDFENLVVIYPNPSDNKMIIQSGNLISEVYIYNALGEIVWSTNSIHTDRIEIEHLNVGIYLAKIIDTKGRIYLEKIMFK